MKFFASLVNSHQFHLQFNSTSGFPFADDTPSGVRQRLPPFRSNRIVANFADAIFTLLQSRERLFDLCDPRKVHKIDLPPTHSSLASRITRISDLCPTILS